MITAEFKKIIGNTFRFIGSYLLTTLRLQGSPASLTTLVLLRDRHSSRKVFREGIIKLCLPDPSVEIISLTNINEPAFSKGYLTDSGIGFFGRLRIWSAASIIYSLIQADFPGHAGDGLCAQTQAM